ncbi:E3 ubiquitin ligase PQT3-like [Carica papaya]|uniref:E3 ubiquitin ligase PQT3-like n=1 Tax=Carica papaya TaxID=3649 RepID=UPI000B8CF3A5|nr:E3 ubiquitin ligase PQT3-like [Carica papaya]
MSVYYKFKSARDYDSIAMDGPFISVGVLKEKIFESKHLGRGTDFDLVVTNAQTNEEYPDEAMLIPKNTSVLIRRVPGRPRLPIVTEQEPKVENNRTEVSEPDKSNIPGTESSTMKYPEDSEWDEFGNDLYSIPEVLPTQSSNPLPDVPPTNKADEESKIKALIDTPALDWQRQGSDGFGPGRGFGRGMAGRMGGRGFGLERKTPPQGYVCHRCKVPGMSIRSRFLDMESARCPPPRNPSPTTSAASKGEKQRPNTAIPETSNLQEVVEEGKAVSALQCTTEKVQTAKTVDASEATHESMSVKEAASQGSAPVVEEEVQQKLGACEPGKKKKKKKARLPANGMPGDLQWKGRPQDQLPENYMMPMGPSPFNPYWTGMQPGMDGFMGPYAGPMSYMNYGLGPVDMPFGAMMPPDPFGAQGFMFPNVPVPPYRDLADFGMGMNVPVRPPLMSREEFEARKADLRRKRENERRGEREFSRDGEHTREVSSSVDVGLMKSKSKPVQQHPPSSSGEHPHHRHRPERLSPERPARDLEPPPRPSKRKSDHHHERERSHDRDRGLDHYDRHEHERDLDRDRHRHHHRSDSSSKPSSETANKPTSSTPASASVATLAAAAAAAADKKHKASVFSRISFPEEEPTGKKRKLSSSEAAVASGSGHQNKAASNGYYDGKPASTTGASLGGKKSSAGDYDSSDDERHFKRKPSRYEPSPPPAAEWEVESPRHLRSARDRDREREYERHGKHR